MTPKVITESAVEPIGLDEAAANLRLFRDNSSSPPGWVEGPRALKLIKTARQCSEEELDISLVAKTLEVAQHSFYPSIELPRGPVRSIVSVTYVDSNGVDQVLAANQYRIDEYASTPALLPAYGVTLPTVRCDLNSVRVRYTVGYSSDDSPPVEVPEPIRQAMHLAIKHWFENRAAVEDDSLAELPLGARYLLSKYRQGLGV